MATLVKVPISFGFTSNPNGTTPTYVAGSSGGAANEAVNLLEAVQSVTVTVTVRSTGQPATVYQAESGGALYTSLATDNQGNVPGWVAPGSYLVTAQASGNFAGASVAFEAVRGDGVTNVAAGAVDMAQLAADVMAALVPTGTVLDYIGQTCPSGFVFGNGAIYATGTVGTTYYNLSGVCGSTWNQGNEGAGNFRVPDLRSVTLVGAGQGAQPGLSVSSRALAAFGGSESLQAHAHGVNDPTHAHSIYDPGHSHGVSIYVNGGGNIGVPYVATGLSSVNAASGLAAISPAGTGIGIYGASTGVSIQNAGAGGAQNMQPFVVVNRLIKL